MFYNRKNMKVRGYLTIEASLIVPLVLLVISFMFYCTYHLYHKCVLAQDVYIVAFRGSAVHDQDSTEIREALEQEAVRQFGNKYFSKHRMLGQAQVSQDTISLEASVTTKTSWMSDLLSDQRWTIRMKREAYMIRPVEWIGRIRRYKEIITN